MPRPGPSATRAIADILERIDREHAPGAARARVQLVSARRYSRVFRVEAGAFPTRAFLKICLDPVSGAPCPEDAARQYRALEDASARMQGSHYRVPRPYLLLEPEGVLVCEWVDGTNVTGHLTRCFTGWRSLEAAISRAAEWLARFHRAFEVARAPLDTMEKLHWIEQWAAAAEFGNGLPSQALRFLADGADTIAGVSLARSVLHGDFKADNVLLGEQTFGIDLHLRHANCTVYDVAAFLNHLEALSFGPSGWQLHSRRARLGSTFVERYAAAAGAALDMTALKWVRLYLLCAARSSLTAGMRARWEYFVSDALLRSCLAQPVDARV